MKPTGFSSVLIANRGEIALRIMRTVRATGRRVIAVATRVDRDALHARFADQTLLIGDGPVADSYLSAQAILAAAHKSGAEAIHPGYGFLSENPDFARACRSAGLVFIGPSGDAMEIMGDKAAAKAAMIKAGVPCVPGYHGPDQSTRKLTAMAREIGYPVMIKAARGGGGRGLRLVPDPERFDAALEVAKSEALGAFGSDAVILEQAVSHPRHVEVQVLADRDGHTIHLGDRDCSIQRRHQKIIEEAPAPGLSRELRGRMARAAVDAARAIGYEGAGTVEFLLGPDDDFYFLEMNTRLQVEHPVTEMVTGLDLVEMQLAIAAGQPLDLAQEEVKIRGHAIEARLYAEDTRNGFLPASGMIERFDIPTQTGVRCDSGVAAGHEISPFYDPMLAKVIAHGETREMARTRLLTTLGRTAAFGPATNRDFLIGILSHQGFADGTPNTGFVGDVCLNSPSAAGPDRALIIAAVAALYRNEAEKFLRAAPDTPRELLGFGSPGHLTSRFRLTIETIPHDFVVRETAGARLTVFADGQAFSAEFREEAILVDNNRIQISALRVTGTRVCLATPQDTLTLHRFTAGRAKSTPGNDGEIRAPMHGTLSEVFVAPGDSVEPGTRLATLEAMKMQHEIVAGVSGRVAEIAAARGDQVKAGHVLMVINRE